MKMKFITLIISLLLSNGLFVSSRKTAENCTVTYIANEGFLIETANHKVLIDALFGNIKGNWCDQPGDSVSRLMTSGIAPFDNINIVLISHRHSDHFNAPMTFDFLRNNKKSVLICPDQVNERLKLTAGWSELSDRIIAIRSQEHPDTSFIVNGISIRALRLKHGSWIETDSATGKRVDLYEGVENIGYLINQDRFVILHTGDCSSSNKTQFNAYNLSTKEIDVAFFDRAFLKPEGLDIISENISTKNIILMHIEPAKREYYKTYVKDIPGFFVFREQMEQKVIIK
jgi:L-ascorbate metabolism protein UlaG (beta-lactamase superfamily)